MNFLYYQHNINNNLISYELITTYAIQSQAYISIFLYIYAYKHIILYILKSSLILVHKHIIMFELGLLIIINSSVHLQPVRHK